MSNETDLDWLARMEPRKKFQGNADRFKPSIEEANRLAQEFRPFTSIEDNQERDMKQDNGWFERGELPPVGVDCQAYVDERWVDAYVVGFIKNGAVTVDVRAYQGGVKSGLRLVTRNAAHFRPIRTERDKAIERMQSDIAERWANCEELAKHLVDKGWVKGGK